jgi:choline dehydrogenase-like flavoprotein
MASDINSNDCIGLGVVPSTTYRGLIITAASAYLSIIPDNLTIMTQAKVTQTLFKGKKATGIKIFNGDKRWTRPSPFVITCFNKKFLCRFRRKDLIVSAGSIDTPKLLLLSGVGPAKDLERHNIPLVADLGGVGSNL